MRNDRRDHVLNLLLEGNSPSGIAQKTAMPLGVVMNHLYNLVGQGRLRRSDVLFSIDPELRRTVEGAIAEAGSSEPRRVRRALQRSGAQLPAEDLDVYLRLRDARVDLGDMYEFIREIELKLHEFIRSSLMAEHGEADWWRKGVPLNVREDCAVMNERDAEPVASLYCYTTVMNLRNILDREWSTISPNLPNALRGDKQQVLADLTRFNRIRNIVMHPVKGILLSDEDFDFVRRLRNALMRATEKARAKMDVPPPNECAGPKQPTPSPEVQSPPPQPKAA